MIIATTILGPATVRLPDLGLVYFLSRSVGRRLHRRIRLVDQGASNKSQVLVKQWTTGL